MSDKDQDKTELFWREDKKKKSEQSKDGMLDDTAATEICNLKDSSSPLPDLGNRQEKPSTKAKADIGEAVKEALNNTPLFNEQQPAAGLSAELDKQWGERSVVEKLKVITNAISWQGRSPARAAFFSYIFPAGGLFYLGKILAGLIFCSLIVFAGFCFALFNQFLPTNLEQISGHNLEVLIGVAVSALVIVLLLAMTTIYSVSKAEKGVSAPFPGTARPLLNSFLAIFFPGLGQYLNGQKIKGFCYFVFIGLGILAAIFFSRYFFFNGFAEDKFLTMVFEYSLIGSFCWATVALLVFYPLSINGTYSKAKRDKKIIFNALNNPQRVVNLRLQTRFKAVALGLLLCLGLLIFFFSGPAGSYYQQRLLMAEKVAVGNGNQRLAVLIKRLTAVYPGYQKIETKLLKKIRPQKNLKDK